LSGALGASSTVHWPVPLVSNTALRVLTAIVAAPAVVGVAYWGGWPFGLLVVGIALLAQVELYRLAEASGIQPQKAWGCVLGALVVIQPLWTPAGALALLVGATLVAALPFVFQRDGLLSSFAVTALGVFYPAALLGFLVRLRLARGPTVGSDEAFDLVLFTLLLVWASDIFAFYVGRAVGRHALAPRISPNKTWEGAVGGLVAATGIAVAFKLTVGAFVGWGHVAALAVIGGVLGPFGDLAESHLKRASEVDDSSSILPGHGGVLDRFDTMALVAPLVYLYLAYIARLVA